MVILHSQNSDAALAQHNASVMPLSGLLSVVLLEALALPHLLQALQGGCLFSGLAATAIWQHLSQWEG